MPKLSFTKLLTTVEHIREQELYLFASYDGIPVAALKAVKDDEHNQVKAVQLDWPNWLQKDGGYPKTLILDNFRQQIQQYCDERAIRFVPGILSV